MAAPAQRPTPPVQTSTATGPHPPARGGYYDPSRSIWVPGPRPKTMPPGPPPLSRPPKPAAPAKGGGKTTVAVGKPVSITSGPPKPPPLTDEQQIAAWVAAAQLPQMQAIQAAQAASQAQYAQQVESTKGYYQALASLMSGIGDQTRAGYSQAAGADAAFGKGFSDGMAQIQAQGGAQTSNLLGVAGAPAAQTAQATADLGGTGATNALYAVGGYIPATTMEREGAAYGAAADLLPLKEAGVGANTIQNLLAQQRADNAKFAQQYSDLAAQVPGLSLQYGSQLATQKATAARDLFNRKVAAQRVADAELNAAALQRDRANQLAWTKWYGTKRTKLDNARYQSQLAQNDRQYKLAVHKYNSSVAEANRRAGIAQQNADTAQTRAQTAATGKKGQTGTGGQKLPSSKDISKIILHWYQGTRSSQRVAVPDPKKPGQQATDKAGNLLWKTVYGSVNNVPYMSAYKQLLDQYGYSDQQARKLLNAVYRRGDYGRGWLTNAEQAALQKAGVSTVTGKVDVKSGGKDLGSRGYINSNQVKALKKAGKPPAGFWYTWVDPNNANHKMTVYAIKPTYQ
jgi:hypothetical protein